jgi:hypothetical protein
MKYQKIIWRAFLPKTNCFSHPPRGYPSVIPAGPTRVTLPAYPPAPPRRTRVGQCPSPQPARLPHAPPPRPRRQRHPPRPSPVPPALCAADGGDNPSWTRAEEPLQVARPSRHVDGADKLPAMGRGLSDSGCARGRSPRLSTRRRGRNPSIRETDVPAASCRASLLRIFTQAGEARLDGAPPRRHQQGPPPKSQRFRRLCSRTTAGLPPTALSAPPSCRPRRSSFHRLLMSAWLPTSLLLQE